MQATNVSPAIYNKFRDIVIHRDGIYDVGFFRERILGRVMKLTTDAKRAYLNKKIDQGHTRQIATFVCNSAVFVEEFALAWAGLREVHLLPDNVKMEIYINL